MTPAAEVFNDFPPQGDFLTDAHRRVLGALTQPAAVEGLQAYFVKHDPKAAQMIIAEGGLEGILEELAEHDLATCLGDVVPSDADARPKVRAKDVAEQIVALCEDSGDVPTLHEEKAAAYVERAQRAGIEPLPARTNSGELWVWTEAGREKLLAPDPRPEYNVPLEGDRLDIALEQDEALYARWEREAEEARAEQARRLRERADQIERGEI